MEHAFGRADPFAVGLEEELFLVDPHTRALIPAAEEVLGRLDLTLTAYSPLAHGKVPRDRDLTAIGEQYGKSAGQVALRWLLDQAKVTTAPKASSHERRLENFEVFDFALTDADRERIAALPKDVRTANPSWAPDWDD